MRTFLLCLMLGACVAPQNGHYSSFEPFKGERIDVAYGGTQGGRFQMSVRQGQGRFELLDRDGQRVGTFALSAVEEQRFRQELEPFKAGAIDYSDAPRTGMTKCPDGVARVHDAGWVDIRWVSSAYDRHFTAELGCTTTRTAERDKAALDFVMRHERGLVRKPDGPH